MSQKRDQCLKANLCYVKRILYLRYIKMSYYFRISVIKYIYWNFATADGFQNGCQELGSKYSLNWMLVWKL
jgi:predicted branched-subunit amino acid permease